MAGEPPGHVHPHHHRQGATWHLRRRLSLCYACEAGRPGAFASLARWRTRRAGRRPIRGGYWKTQATISNSPRAVRAVIPVPARAPARVPAGAAAAARVLVAVPMVPATVWAAATAAAPGAAAAAAAGAGAGPAVVRLVRAAPVPAVPASAERDRRVLHRRPLRAGGRALLASGHDSPPTAGYPARRRMRPIEEALAERYPGRVSAEFGASRSASPGPPHLGRPAAQRRRGPTISLGRNGRSGKQRPRQSPSCARCVCSASTTRSGTRSGTGSGAGSTKRNGRVSAAAGHASRTPRSGELEGGGDRDARRSRRRDHCQGSPRWR